MTRGDLIVVALSGDYGKPRPALVVQSDALEAADSVLVCPLTSDTRSSAPFRLQVEPAAGSGLRAASLVMTEKLTAVPRAKCGAVIGRLQAHEIDLLNGHLAYVLGLGD